MLDAQSVEVTAPVEQVQPGDEASALPVSDPAQNQAEEQQQPDEPAEEGSIVVEASGNHPPGDPIAQINEQTYTVVASIDQAFVEPVALAYRDALPSPVRRGLSNFFRNLREPVVFLNFLLQGQVGHAVETLARFAVNSTVGIGGLLDVASADPINLPFRENGFADTLGFYGVQPGAFLYLPLVGPTTVRDGIGDFLDTLVLPLAVGRPFNTPYYAVTAYTIRSLDERVELDDRYRIIRASASPYDLMRQIYLCERQSEIDTLRGREAEDCVDTFRLDEPPPQPVAPEADEVAPQAEPVAVEDQGVEPADQPLDVLPAIEPQAQPQ